MGIERGIYLYGLKRTQLRTENIGLVGGNEAKLNALLSRRRHYVKNDPGESYSKSNPNLAPPCSLNHNHLSGADHFFGVVAGVAALAARFVDDADVGVLQPI